MTSLMAPTSGTGDVLLANPLCGWDPHMDYLAATGTAGPGVMPATDAGSGLPRSVVASIESLVSGSLSTSHASRSMLVMWDPTPLDINASFATGLRAAFETFRSAFDSTQEPPRTVEFVANALGRFTIGPDCAARWDRPFLRTSGSLVHQAPITALATDDRFEEAADRLPFEQTASHVAADVASGGVVSTIRSLEVELGVALKDVLSAADIKKRTFHAWDKPNKPQPRVASQGLLWRLVDAVEDVRELVDGPIQHWLHADGERLDALRQARFDDLVEMAVGTRERHQARSANRGGLGADVDFPLVRSVERPIIDDDVDEV